MIDDLDLSASTLQEDRYPAYARRREAAPVHHELRYGVYTLIGYRGADAQERLYSTAIRKFDPPTPMEGCT